MTKGCYTCRRRRIICDNGLPTCRKCRDAGKECLGYKKPLVWVKGGVASRGKMMGRSFDDVNKDDDDARKVQKRIDHSTAAAAGFPTSAEPQQHPTNLQQDPFHTAQFDEQESASPGAIVAVNRVQSPQFLVDPLFKDCSRLSRFYIDHFNQNFADCFTLYSGVKNPYRDLIPLVGDSPVIAHSLAATGALHYAILANGELPCMPWSPETSSLSWPPEKSGLAQINRLSRFPTSKMYQNFLGLKQRALRQLSQDIHDPVMRNDNRTLAAIMLLAMMDAIESGHESWKYHVEGANKLLQSREYGNMGQTQRMWDWLDNFAADACLLIQLMGSTLARPGSLSKPFYSSAMGAPALKRLEETSWVGCPAYLLESIFFIHEFFDLNADNDSNSQVTTVFPSVYMRQGSNPLQCPENLPKHIQAFDPVGWAESLQSYFFLPDLSGRITLAKVYKAAVYLYATRVLSHPRPGSTTISTTFGLPPDHAEVAGLLIHHISLIPDSDPHFKCLIWPTFIAGAECRDPAQRQLLLQTLRTLYYQVTSVNVLNAAWVLTMMWRKRDVRREEKTKWADSDSSLRAVSPASLATSTPNPISAATPSAATPPSPNEYHDDDDDDFDWIQELDDAQVDWLFI